MKQRAKVQIMVASLLFVALLAALWKASSPTRMRKQFQDQANAQLCGKSTGYYKNLEKVVVTNFQRSAKSGGYYVEYQVWWHMRNRLYKIPPVAIKFHCFLNDSQGKSSGSCSIDSARQEDPESSFHVSIRE